VVKRMERVRPASSWLARLGADQFAIVTHSIPQDEDVARLTDHRHHETFGVPFDVDGKDLRVSACMGIAIYPGDGADAESLLLNAEAALKKAKAAGERYVFYTQGLSERAAERLRLENELRQAVEQEQFILHYQPKVQMGTRRIVGVEALVRWQSPQRGLVPPIQFIPVLEETGLILEVGNWVLRRACGDHHRWRELGITAPKIAVNVSAMELRRRDFVATVELAVKQASAQDAIEVEITESVVMEDIRETTEKLIALRGMGIGVAIDDFGTGYSSLAYLARLPVETLKIDRSFVKTMADEPANRTLVQTIVSLAHSLRLIVVAEGVETEQQEQLLRELACDQMQGYLFSKPVPFETMTQLLRPAGA
jgi:diguanylate cyclase